MPCPSTKPLGLSRMVSIRSLYESHEDDALAEQEALTDALCSTIEEIEQWRKRPAPALTALSWDSLKSKYQALLERTA